MLILREPLWLKGSAHEAPHSTQYTYNASNDLYGASHTNCKYYFLQNKAKQMNYIIASLPEISHDSAVINCLRLVVLSCLRVRAANATSLNSLFYSFIEFLYSNID